MEKEISKKVKNEEEKIIDRENENKSKMEKGKERRKKMDEK